MTLFKNLTDTELILAYQQSQDARAFGELYNRYNKKVYLYCNKILKNREDAYDVTQDIFVKISVSILKLKDPNTLVKWLFLVARNACLDLIQKNKRSSTTTLESEDLIPEDVFDMEAALGKEELFNKMESALNQLKPEDKTFLEAKYFHGKSVKDLTQTYGMSASAVKMRLMRTRQKVQNLSL